MCRPRLEALYPHAIGLRRPSLIIGIREIVRTVTVTILPLQETFLDEVDRRASYLYSSHCHFRAMTLITLTIVALFTTARAVGTNNFACPSSNGQTITDANGVQ